MKLFEEKLELTIEEVEYIIAFIRSHEWNDIPKTLRDNILPKLEDFQNDCYYDCY